MKSKIHSVAVVILTWNDWSNTIECLGSLFKNDYSNFDIILIDNNSEQFHYNKILDWCYKKKIHINFINKKRKISPFKLKKIITYLFTKVVKLQTFHLQKIWVLQGATIKV